MTFTRRHRLFPSGQPWAPAGALAVLLLVGAAARAQVTYQAVYVTSDPAPGAADGALFSGFAYPVISPNGSIAFTAFLKATPGAAVDLSTGQSIFGPTPTGTGLIGRSNEPPAGIADKAVNSGFFSPVLSDEGLFYRTLLRTGAGTPVDTTNDNALHVATLSSGSQLVAREGGPSPGIVGDLPLSQYTSPPLLMNHAGQIALEGFLALGGAPAVTLANDNVILAPTPGGAGIVAREDHRAPGTTDGAEFNTFENPVLNNLGQIAFNATLRTGVGGAPVGFGNDAALFGPMPAGLGPIAREGDPAPGAPGASYGLLGKPSLNAAGDVTFYSILNGAPSATARAVFGPTGAGLGLVARGGDPAPGAGGDVYNDFAMNVLMNESGGVAFKSQLRAAGGGSLTNADAIFGPTPTGLGMIARAGQPAPGVADDAQFGFLTDAFTMNRWGDLVFDASLRDGPSNSVNASNDRGIFAYSHLTDSVTLIAREGDLFDLGEGAYLGPRHRTIQSWELITGSAGGDGLAASLNDRGQLLFELIFTDFSSALVIAQLPSQVPEPTTATLLLLLLVGWAGTAMGRFSSRRGAETQR